MLASVTLPALFATTAFVAGVGGMVVTVWLVPRRFALSSIVLWAGLMALVAAAVLAGSRDPELDPAWSGRLAVAALTLLAAAGILLVVDLRARDRLLRVSSGDAETLRRDIDRLNGINVRLEDEVRESRRAARNSSDQRSAPSSVIEATLARHRKALDTSAAQLRKLRAVFDGALDGLALLERESLRMVDSNPALQRATGYDAKELSQRSLLDLLGGDAARPGKTDLQRCARERRPLGVLLVRKDGTEVPVDLVLGVIAEGDEAQLLASVRDASARNTVENDQDKTEQTLRSRIRSLEAEHADQDERLRNLEQANRRLAEISDRKDHFVSAVSHELRTPLTSIRSFAEILIKHGDEEPEVRAEFLDIIHKESERLTRLVNNVLDLARIEAGATKLLHSEFDARTVAEDAVSSMKGTAAARGVTVVAYVGHFELVMRADRDRVQQVLMNLVSNAIKFSPEGSEIDVRVEAGDLPGRIRFVVTDRGRGIPPEDIDRVFDRFHRVDAEPGAAGTGLGLAICREIVQLHGGRVWAESELGHGSTFRAEFPGVEEARSRTPGAGDSTTGALPTLSSRDAVPAGSDSRGRSDGWSTTGTLPPLGLR